VVGKKEGFDLVKSTKSGRFEIEIRAFEHGHKDCRHILITKDEDLAWLLLEGLALLRKFQQLLPA
jgi:hypothetical protein